MSSFYDPSSKIGQLRLEIGDTRQGFGVRPDGSNFDDTELQVWLDREGHVMRAAAAALEALARTWAKEVDMRMGPRSESASQASTAYLKAALALRGVWGDTPGAATDGGGPGVMVLEGDKSLFIDFTPVTNEWA